MKRTLAITIALFFLCHISPAQSRKELIAELQSTSQLTQVLQKKVDSLERVCLKYEATIASLDSKIEKVTVKLYEQAEENDKRIKKLEDNLPENKPFEFVPNKKYNANRLLVKKGAYFGYIDREENLVVPCIYDDANSFYDSGVAGVMKDGKWGLIDREGNVIVPFELNGINERFFGSDLLLIKKDDKYGVFRVSDNQYVLPVNYDDIRKGCWDNGVYQFVIKDKGKVGVIDITGKVVISVNYRDLTWISSSYYYQGKDMTGEYFDYYLDNKGNKISRY